MYLMYGYICITWLLGGVSSTCELVTLEGPKECTRPFIGCVACAETGDVVCQYDGPT